MIILSREIYDLLRAFVYTLLYEKLRLRNSRNENYFAADEKKNAEGRTESSREQRKRSKLER